MNIRVVKAGLRVQEIPSHEHLRIHGASNLRAVRDGLRVLKVILRERGSRPRRRPRPAVLSAAANAGAGVASATASIASTAAIVGEGS